MSERRTESGLAVEDLPPRVRPSARTAGPNEEAKWFVWRIVCDPKFAGRLAYWLPGEYRFGRPAPYMLWRLFPERVTLYNLAPPGFLLLNGRCVPGESLLRPGDQLRIGPLRLLEAWGWRDQR